jgi:hypothetical protein
MGKVWRSGTNDRPKAERGEQPSSEIITVQPQHLRPKSTSTSWLEIQELACFYQIKKYYLEIANKKTSLHQVNLYLIQLQYEVETVQCVLFCILYNSVLYMFRPLGHHQKDNLVSTRGNALQ